MVKKIFILGVLPISIFIGCGSGSESEAPNLDNENISVHSATKVNSNNVLAVFQDSEYETNVVEILLYDKSTNQGNVEYYIVDNTCLRDVEKKDYNYALDSKTVKKVSEGYTIIYNDDTNITRLVDNEGNFTKLHFKSSGINLTIGRLIKNDEGSSIGSITDKIFITTQKSANYERSTINEQMCEY